MMLDPNAKEFLEGMVEATNNEIASMPVSERNKRMDALTERPWFRAAYEQEEFPSFFADEDTPSFADVRQSSLRADEYWFSYRVVWEKQIIYSKRDTIGIVRLLFHRDNLETNHDWFLVTYMEAGMEEPIQLYEGFLDEAWTFFKDIGSNPNLVFSMLLFQINEVEREMRELRERKEAEEMAALAREMDDVMLLEREDFGGF